MTLTTLDQLIEELPGQTLKFFKRDYDVHDSSAAQTFYSMWTLGGWPVAGSTPASGSGAVPTDATAGALPFTNPSGGELSYLARLAVSQSSGLGGALLVLYDRLVHTSGLSGATTGAQTVNTTAITRPSAAGDDVAAFVEIYSQIGGTSRALTVTYTNTTPTGSRTGTCNIGGTNNRDAGTMIPINLAAGDTGVKSVQSVSIATTTGAAGDFGITLLRRIATVSLQWRRSPVLDAWHLGLPRIYDDACLAFMVATDGSAQLAFHGEMQLVQH